MVDTSEWLEARSTDKDATRVQRHLDKLLEAMILAAARRRGADDVLSLIRTVPDPDGANHDPVSA